MEARLSAVQQRLLLVLAASILLAILVRPQLGNGRLRGALNELTTLNSGFERTRAERALRDQAERKAAAPLSTLAVGTGGKRGAKIEAAFDAPKVLPVSTAQLRNLEELSHYVDRAGSVTVGVPRLRALADSMLWRLARLQRTGTLQLRSVELVGADLSAQDLAAELAMPSLREQSLAARNEADLAARKVAAAERTVERRSKRSAHTRREAAEKLREARAVSAEKAAAHAAMQAKYDQAAQQAFRVRSEQPLQGIPDIALARVTLQQGKERIVLSIPVPLEQQQVSVGPLSGLSFQAVREAGFWPEVAQLTPNQALQHVQGQLSWHFRELSLLGLPLTGNTILQLVPCILPCLLYLLLMRMQRAERAYNPFTTKVPNALPRVGFKSRFFEFVVVILLPLLAVASATASLLLIDQPPIFPALSALLCVLLGSAAFGKLRDLREMSTSIVRSHSIPPPL